MAGYRISGKAFWRAIFFTWTISSHVRLGLLQRFRRYVVRLANRTGAAGRLPTSRTRLRRSMAPWRTSLLLPAQGDGHYSSHHFGMKAFRATGQRAARTCFRKHFVRVASFLLPRAVAHVLMVAASWILPQIRLPSMVQPQRGAACFTVCPFGHHARDLLRLSSCSLPIDKPLLGSNDRTGSELGDSAWGVRHRVGLVADPRLRAGTR